ncbi:MAG: cobalamin-dependent protein [Nocardioides sp.]|nr:cobalamin-dependent protein [Nocardioides sp.]
MPNQPAVGLRAAAAELGVHYQTAYRWVRNGRLPATIIAGKYSVSRSDLDEFAQLRTRSTPVSTPSPQRLDGQAARMHEALRSGDDPAARQIARRLADDGTPVKDLITQVLSPSLRQLGQSWHDGEISIWVEHRASAIVERIVAELTPTPRGRRRGTVMVAAVAGDLHTLPTAMAAAALRADNWRVEHLGANIPAEELVDFCATHDISVAVLSSTNSDVADVVQRAATALRSSGTPVVIGGPGRSLDDLLAEVRAATAPAATE